MLFYAIVATMAFVGFSIATYIYGRLRDHMKILSGLIPAVGFVAALWCLALALPLSFLITVESILVALEAAYFFGPFRTSGWGWPKECKPKAPRLVSRMLIGLAILATILITCFRLVWLNQWIADADQPYTDQGMALYGYPGYDASVLWQIVLTIGTGILSYLALLGLYLMVVGCISLKKEHKTGVLSKYWIDGHAHLVSFDSDTNAYHVSPKLYDYLKSRRRGLTFAYTLVTSLNGRQFIRKPPVVTVPVPALGYMDYGHMAKEPTPLDHQDVEVLPAPRLLGGDAAGSAYNLGRLFPN